MKKATSAPKHILDYWKRPEYLYLGPDENMHDEMIQWIADYSKKYRYRPGGCIHLRQAQCRHQP